MLSQTLVTAYGCMLHDFGKLLYRSGRSPEAHGSLGYKYLKDLMPGDEWQEVLDCLRWHHGPEIETNLPAESCAYIVYAANRLASSGFDDFSKIEGEGKGNDFAKDMPLSPVFTHMNGESKGYSVYADPLESKLKMPSKDRIIVSPSKYEDAQKAIADALTGQYLAAAPSKSCLNSFLYYIESLTGNFPSEIIKGKESDISFYDHLKAAAGIGSCISEYLASKNVYNFKEYLYDKEAEFRKENAFVLYSADLSGIQKFIYTVANTKALRSLRSRSFFLGLLMEHYSDELLTGCGLSRANLLYSGGGHCYILLPNTDKAVQTAEELNLKFNDYLCEEFGTSLFLGHGYTKCSANDLINFPAEKAPYKAMFRRVSAEISAHKMHRYSAGQILALNSSDAEGERECRICGRTDSVNKSDVCSWCRLFAGDLSYNIQKEDFCLVTDHEIPGYDFRLPSIEEGAYFTFTSNTAKIGEYEKSHGGLRRIYAKNYVGRNFTNYISLYVGDYAYDNLMDELSDAAEGIKRLSVCRMDVDNLGQAFVAGFEDNTTEDPIKKYRFVTISRTAAFSRQMCLFFQFHINDILNGKYKDRKPLAVSIVYSGGDDVFLVGAWNEVLEAANRIQEALTEYTCGSLTISGGLGLFHDKFPIRVAAAQTAELEDRAKKEPEKSAVSLFDPEAEHTYSWEVFRKDVEDNKLKELQNFFKAFPERGNSFLYNLLTLLRPVNKEDSRINLARYAYQLARLEPKRRDPRFEDYRKFSDKMMEWALNEKDRGQLITAIYIYVYLNRKV